MSDQQKRFNRGGSFGAALAAAAGWGVDGAAKATLIRERLLPIAGILGSVGSQVDAMEMVIVRHFDAYYKIQVENGEEVVIVKYTDSDAKKWEKRFIRALSQDLAAQADKARIDAALGRQATAAA